MGKVIEKILEHLQEKAEITIHLLDLAVSSNSAEINQKARRGPKQFKGDWAELYKEKQQMYSLLNKLKREGLIAKRADKVGSIWNITKLGREKLQKLKKKNTTSEGREVIIVAYDIPERERRKRNLLRKELFSLGFKKLQHSVWVGKISVPTEFITGLKEQRLLPYVHIFSINRQGTVADKFLVNN